MNIAYDIDCIIKFPEQFQTLIINGLGYYNQYQYFISNIYSEEQMIALLSKQTIQWLNLIPRINIYSGNKTQLLKDLKIDILYDTSNSSEPVPLQVCVVQTQILTISDILNHVIDLICFLDTTVEHNDAAHKLLKLLQSKGWEYPKNLAEEIKCCRDRNAIQIINQLKESENAKSSTKTV